MQNKMTGGITADGRQCEGTAFSRIKPKPVFEHGRDAIIVRIGGGAWNVVIGHPRPKPIGWCDGISIGLAADAGARCPAITVSPLVGRHERIEYHERFSIPIRAKLPAVAVAEGKNVRIKGRWQLNGDPFTAVIELAGKDAGHGRSISIPAAELGKIGNQHNILAWVKRQDREGEVDSINQLNPAQIKRTTSHIAQLDEFKVAAAHRVKHNLCNAQSMKKGQCVCISRVAGAIWQTSCRKLIIHWKSGAVPPLRVIGGLRSEKQNIERRAVGIR